MRALTVTGARLGDQIVGLRALDGVIEEIGADVTPRAGDAVIDAGGEGLALLPGLVNAHTHAAMTLFRGYADDLPLMEWLERYIWPAEARLEAEDVYWGARLACVEMIRTGTVRFWDMYWHPEATARAVEDAGLRATIGAPLLDVGGGGAPARLRSAALESLDALAQTGPRVAPSLAPHAIYTVSEQSLRWIGETAAERGLPIQVHLSETAAEVERCLAEHGSRPAVYLDRLGVLGPRTVLAHGVFLDEAELELIAGRGATIATNPSANMKLAVGGVFPWPQARAHGAAVGLGTDGAGSNNSLDLLAEMKQFALVQKHSHGDPAIITAAEVLEIAAGRRAPMLGATALEPGAAADFLLVRADSHELALGSLEAGLAYAASGSVVDTTVVAGRPLMRGGRVEELDEVVARCRERAARLGLARPR